MDNLTNEIYEKIYIEFCKRTQLFGVILPIFAKMQLFNLFVYSSLWEKTLANALDLICWLIF